MEHDIPWGPLEASFAVRDLEPKYVIPMHYNTFPQITQDPKKFEKLVLEKSPNVQVKIMAPSNFIEINK